jgi:hypothetical protein
VRAEAVRGEVGGDGEFGAAGAAENRGSIEFGAGPSGDRVAGEGFVAVFAGVILSAAFHLDGDDVGGAVPVAAARLGVEIESVNFRRWIGMHTSTLRRSARYASAESLFEIPRDRGFFAKRYHRR